MYNLLQDCCNSLSPSFSKLYPDNLETEFNALPDSENIGFLFIYFFCFLCICMMCIWKAVNVFIEMTSFWPALALLTTESTCTNSATNTKRVLRWL